MKMNVGRSILFVLALAAAVALAVTVMPTFARADSPVQMSVISDDPNPRLPAPGCEERCKLLGERVLKACIDKGGSEQRCENQAAIAVRECLANCPKNEQPPTCVEQCRLKGERLLQACLAQGGAPEDCKAKATATARECVAECPKNEEPPTCVEQCRLKGERLLQACLAQGVAPERCRAKVDATVRECVAECPRSGVEPRPVRPDPNDCHGACKARGRELYKKCVDDGGTPDRCERRAKQYIETCIREHCPPKPREPAPDPDPPVRPAPGACEDACTARGKVWFEQCVKENKAPERCRAAAAEKIKECIAANCPKPVDPPTCRESCHERGKVIFKKCMARSDDEKACHQIATDYIKNCIEKHCPPASVVPSPGQEPRTCAEKCAVLGREQYDKCLKSSLAPSPERCLERAGELVRKCVAEHC